MIKLKNLIFETFDTSKPFSTTDPASNGTQINPGNDPWQYLQKNGKWLTRRKGSSNWTNMKTALSAENYNKAVAVLQKYIDARNKVEDGSNSDNNKINIQKELPVFTIDYANTEMKPMMDRVNARRHPEVKVLGRSDDGAYLKIENPRNFAINHEVYVNTSDFKSTSPSGDTAKYVGTDKQYNLYRIK
jgi:hypothetical protein